MKFRFKTTDEYKSYFDSLPSVSVRLQRLREDEPYNTRTAGWVVELYEHSRESLYVKHNTLIEAYDMIYLRRENSLNTELDKFIQSSYERPIG